MRFRSAAVFFAKFFALKIDGTQDPPSESLSQLYETHGDANITDRNHFDVSADGQRFLFTSPAEGAQPNTRRMVLVQNWERELESQ